MFLLEGFSVIFATAMALFKINQDKILEKKEMENVKKKKKDLFVPFL